jgi:hypothetical protein
MDIETLLLFGVALIALGFDVVDIYLRIQGFRRRKEPQTIRWNF